MKLKKLLAVFLALTMIVSCMGITAFAETKTPVNYLSPVYNTSGDSSSGVKEWAESYCSDYTLITSGSAELVPGWYVVDGTGGSVDVTGTLSSLSGGDVNIILKDNSQLNINLTAAADKGNSGILMDNSGILNIYTQSHGNDCGKLTIQTDGADAIYTRDGITINGEF